VVLSSFRRGLARLDDGQWWDWLGMSADAGTAPPRGSVLHCERHRTFALRVGAPWQDIAAEEISITIWADRGPERFGKVVFGTGFAVELSRPPSLSAAYTDVQLWRDRVPTEAAARYPKLACFHYLYAEFISTPDSS
jgi:hypothetical protein